VKKNVAVLLRRIARRLDPSVIPQAPSLVQLQENVTHVCYEVAAMERAAQLRTQGGRFRFEAFYVHARLLREFLWGTSSAGGTGAQNSLLAEHYFDSVAEWRTIRGGLPPTLSATKERVDRQISHLARDRHSDFVDLEVAAPNVLAEIMAQWNRFENALPQAWKGPFATELAKRRSELAKNVF
jgi:hypothetical protein